MYFFEIVFETVAHGDISVSKVVYCLQGFGVALALLCAKGEHCAADIREKLRLWGIGENDADTIVEKLLNQGFINETRYAKAYIHDKYRFAKWGRIKIEQGLRQRHRNHRS